MLGALGDEGAFCVTTSKVELYAAIRRDARAGMSGRAMEKKYRVGRRTIVKAVSSAWPERRKQLPPRGSKLDPFKPAIDGMLNADLDAPRKQRHTVMRIYRRLMDEHGMADVSYPVVRVYVAERKPQIRAEAGRGPAEVFVPQSHRPGDEAEVDFGMVVVRLAGQDVTCFLFCLRLSFSGKAVHRVSLSGGQEAFFEGHEHAFRVLGGVPSGKIRYDNLKAAVAQVTGLGRLRVEVDRWTAFWSHWGIDAFHCRPGIGGAHEKGGVEGQIGWFRRNHLVPVPEVESIRALNEMIDAWDTGDEERRIGSRARAVGEFLAIERPLLAPLPAEPFETGLWLSPRVDRFAQVMVRNNRYSVPVRLIGRRVRSCCTPRTWSSTTAAPRWPGTSGCPAGKAPAWTWTTTCKRWSASPARCPARPRWNKPAPPGSSPLSTTPGGRRPARPTVMPPAPGRWSRSCSCTATPTASTSSPGWPPLCGPGR
jgi:transposase